MAKVLDFIKQIYRGRTIYRIYLNRLIAREMKDMAGDFLDLAGGSHPSYLAYLPAAIRVIKTNRLAEDGVGAVDFNRTLPFGEGEFDGVMLFNAIYIAEDQVATLTEINRVLKPGAVLVLASPFIANEMPEPHDYCRPTAEGLRRALARAGFGRVAVWRFGERFTAAAYLLHPLVLLKTLRLLMYLIAMALDWCLPGKIKRNYPVPLGYFVVARKSQS